MESLAICVICVTCLIVFVLMWTIFFRKSEKNEPNPNPDVINSGTNLPDAELANQDQTTMIPGTRSTRYASVLSQQPTARLNRFKCDALSSIPENKDGEDFVAEMEKVSAELKKTKSELQQQQKQTVLSLAEQQEKSEMINLRKLLSEETTITEQLG